MGFDRSSTKLGRFFENLLDACADNSVVLLIDEYDAPLTKSIDQDTDSFFEDTAALLRSFTG